MTSIQVVFTLFLTGLLIFLIASIILGLPWLKSLLPKKKPQTNILNKVNEYLRILSVLNSPSATISYSVRMGYVTVPVIEHACAGYSIEFDGHCLVIKKNNKEITCFTSGMAGSPGIVIRSELEPSREISLGFIDGHPAVLDHSLLDADSDVRYSVPDTTIKAFYSSLGDDAETCIVKSIDIMASDGQVTIKADPSNSVFKMSEDGAQLEELHFRDEVNNTLVIPFSGVNEMTMEFKDGRSLALRQYRNPEVKGFRFQAF